MDALAAHADPGQAVIERLHERRRPEDEDKPGCPLVCRKRETYEFPSPRRIDGR